MMMITRQSCTIHMTFLHAGNWSKIFLESKLLSTTFYTYYAYNVLQVHCVETKFKRRSFIKLFCLFHVNFCYE